MVLVKSLRLFTCLLLLLFLTAGPVLAQPHSSYEDYQSQLELEYFVPVITYDGSFYVATYGKMSSILRDQELQFVFLGTEKDLLNFCLGYTLHAPYWSYGLNLYHMPVYTGPLWSSGFWELQRGLVFGQSALYKRTTLDLRLQYEDFAPLSWPTYPVDSAALFGVEATVTRDNFNFLPNWAARVP